MSSGRRRFISLRHFKITELPKDLKNGDLHIDDTKITEFLKAEVDNKQKMRYKNEGERFRF